MPIGWEFNLQSMAREKIIILPRLHTFNGDASKQWFVYYSYRDPNTGKMKRFRIYDGFSQYKSVKLKTKFGNGLVASLKEKLLNGWSPFEDRSTVIYSDDLVYRSVANKYGRMRDDVKSFNYYINEYMKGLHDVRPSTYATYKSKFRYFQEFLVSKKMEGNHISEFQKAQANDFNLYLKDTRSLSAKSINQYNVLMRSFFKWLIKNDNLRMCPFLGIKKLKVVTQKPRVYTSDYMRKVTDWASKNDTQFLLVIRIIYNCLIRPGELRKLRIRDVNLFSSQITVPAAVAKNGMQRVVDIPDYLCEELKRAELENYPDTYFLISFDGIPGIKMVGKNNLYNRFVRMRRETQIPRDYILYAFKHTGMVELKLSGADWLEVKTQVGHQSLDQVIEYMTELMGQSSEHIRKRAPRI